MTPSPDSRGREELSALFDGELTGDAARFAHKRLAQDAQWRHACGTWQLVGDVLRGHATAAAPPDFADRVRLGLARESATVADAPSRSRRGWIGGAALAASVAVAAWFVSSPLDEAAPASRPAATAATTPSPQSASEPAAVIAATAPAAGASAREFARLSPRQGERGAARGSRASAVTGAASPTPTTTSPLLDPSPASDHGGIESVALSDPFQVTPAPIAVKPWPRAVLPDYPVTGALTAGYAVPPQHHAAAGSGSPGFYPFEPRLPPDADDTETP